MASTTVAIELRGVEKATVAIQQIDPALPPDDITSAIKAALINLAYRVRTGLAEPGEWKPLNGIGVTEVDSDAT